MCSMQLVIRICAGMQIEARRACSAFVMRWLWFMLNVAFCCRT